MEPTRPRHVPVVGTPEDLQAGIPPLDRRPPRVEPLEFIGPSRDRREAAQIEVARNTGRQAPVPPRVAPRVAGALPALVPRRAAVAHRATALFIADIRHLVTHGWVADRVVAEHRPRL